MKKTNKYLLLFISVILLAFLCSCGNKVGMIYENAGNETLDVTEEPMEYNTNEYGHREPDLAINNEEAALEIGTIILMSNFNVYDIDTIRFGIQDKGEYWRVYSYIPHPTDENGEIIGYTNSRGGSVTFRKSDCKIIDIGME